MNSTDAKSVKFAMSGLLLFAIFGISRTQWCLGRDGVFPAFERTIFPMDVEPLLKNGIEAGTKSVNEDVAIESDGREITITTHWRDLNVSDVFKIKSSGEVRENWWISPALIGKKLDPLEARGLISILQGASNFMRAGGGAGGLQEADELEQMATTVDKLLPK
jgi:hypothetical protein